MRFASRTSSRSSCVFVVSLMRRHYRAAVSTRSIGVRVYPWHNSRLMTPENYTEIQRVLTEERSLADAAEAHGTLAGCLCAAIGYRFEDWLLEILPEGQAHPMAKETLRALYVATAGALEGPEMEFELLLPDDQ